MQTFFAALFCVYGDNWNPKQKAKRCTENFTSKLQNSNQTYTFPPPGGTPLYGLYRYVPRNRVCFLKVLDP